MPSNSRSSGHVSVRVSRGGIGAGRAGTAAIRRVRHRHRDSGRQARAHLRVIPSGRRINHSQVRRHRPGADDLLDADRADGRSYLESRASRERAARSNSQLDLPLGAVPERSYDHELAGARVLVVDDNQLNCRILSEFLSRLQMVVMTADRGADAVRLVETARANAEPFDIVLLDAIMPEMDGFAVAERIAGGPGPSADRDVDVGQCPGWTHAVPPAGYRRVPDEAGSAGGAVRRNCEDHRSTPPRGPARAFRRQPQGRRRYAGADPARRRQRDQPEGSRSVCSAGVGTSSTSPRTAPRRCAPSKPGPMTWS